MVDQIRIAIAGHGNLGRGVEIAIDKNPDMQLVGIYTRRAPEQLKPLQAGTPVFGMAALSGHTELIDVLILCGGSKADLPQQGPELAPCTTGSCSRRVPSYWCALAATKRTLGTTPALLGYRDPAISVFAYEMSMRRLV